VNAGPLVRARGISKRFAGPGGPVDAVRDAELTVAPGEVVLLLGPSGGGKTTLLSILGCVARPTSGALDICGRDAATLGPRERPAFRLRHVGFVFQTHRLLDALTAAENVEVPLGLAGVPRPESRERARGLLERLGLSHRAGFRPDALSGGERQRVAVARALALDPPLLLADEPTGTLDSAAGTAVIELLRGAAAERGAGVVIATHDERVAARADIVLRMEDGRLAPGTLTKPGPIPHA